MKRLLRRCAPALAAAALAAVSAQLPAGPEADRDRKLPDGRSQTEAILKADHLAGLKDAAALVKLAEELKLELERNDRHVLSVASIRKTEEIEKLAKRIRSRLRRH